MDMPLFIIELTSVKVWICPLLTIVDIAFMVSG